MVDFTDASNLYALDRRSYIIFGELLPMILDNLASPDLVTLRLVNRAWEKEATHLLTKRDDLKISFIFCPHANPPTFTLWCCDHHSDHLHDEDGGKTIADFSKFLKSTLQVDSPKSETECESDSSDDDGCPFFVSRFSFDYCRGGGALELPEVLEFFHIYGAHIKQLDFQTFPDYPSGWNSRSVLRYTPNLETLKVRVFNVQHQSTANNPTTNEDQETAPVTFHKLKVLKISSSTLFYPQGVDLQNLTDLLTHANCLELIDVSELSLDSSLISTLNNVKKLHLLHVEKLTVDLVKLLASNFNPRELDNLEKLTSAAAPKTGYQLKHVKLKGVEANWRVTSASLWRRSITSLVKLLEMNSKSLEYVQLKNLAVHLWTGLKFRALLPKLPNVVTMRVSYDDESTTDESNPFGFLPRGVFDNFPFPASSLSSKDLMKNYKLATIFPGLTTIKIKSWEDEHHPNRLPFWNDVLPSVRIFRMRYKQSLFPQILNQLPVMFPGLEELDLKEVNMSEVVQLANVFVAGLWKLEQLVVLRLRLKAKNVETLEHELFPLGAALLGLKMETLQQVYQNWKKSKKWTIPKEESLNLPSIFDLHDFKGISLLLFDLRLSDHNCGVCMFFAGLIGQLAKDKMVELCVEIDSIGGVHASAYPNPAQYLEEHFSEPLSRQFANISLHLP